MAYGWFVSNPEVPAEAAAAADRAVAVMLVIEVPGVGMTVPEDARAEALASRTRVDDNQCDTFEATEGRRGPCFRYDVPTAEGTTPVWLVTIETEYGWLATPAE